MTFDDHSHEQVGRGEHIIGSVFCLLGIGVLLPWNAFISAKPYFEARRCDGDGHATDGYDVEEWFGLVFNLASVSSLGLIILVQYLNEKRKARRQEQLGTPLPFDEIESIVRDPVADESSRVALGRDASGQQSVNYGFFMVTIPLSIYFMVFLATTVFVLLPQMAASNFFRLTIVGLAFCGASCAMAAAGITASASMFGHRIGINAYLSGQAAGGLIVAVANFIASIINGGARNKFWNDQCNNMNRLLQESDDHDNSSSCAPYREVDWSTFAYFGLGCFVLFVCIVGYEYIQRSQLASNLREHERIQRNISRNDSETLEAEASFRPGIELHQREDSSVTLTRARHRSHQNRVTTECQQDTTFQDELNEDTEERSRQHRQFEDDGLSALGILIIVRAPAFAIWLTFFVTLVIFPSWTSRLESVHKCQSGSRLQNDLFTPMTFVLFNAGDLAGRLFSSIIKVEENKGLSRKLVFAAMVRVVFVPLFLLCSATGSAFNSISFQSDVFSICMQLAFSTTNGMLVSVSFMHASSSLSSSEKVQETCAALLNFSLQFGLLCGAFFAVVFSKVASG